MEQKLNVKIAKTATQRSIMDVTASLDYRKTNSKNEDVYKGSIIFSITEVQGGKYEKAWVSKAKAKMLLTAVIQNNFEDIFGSNGFNDYGGTAGPTPRARVLNIKMTPKKQYVFTINEGPGKLGENGSIQMVGKPEKTVQTYVAFHEAMQLAHEVYDYIRDEETKAMLNGKPLYTIMPYQANALSKEKIVEKKEYQPTSSSVSTEDKVKENLSKMTGAQLKKMYDTAKTANDEKSAKIISLITEEMNRRKEAQSAG